MLDHSDCSLSSQDQKESRRVKSSLFSSMNLFLLFTLLAGAQASLLFGRCSPHSCENEANCIQFSPSRFYCQCIDANHYGLRCEYKKCQNGNSETPCETTAKCDGPNCPSTANICERDRPCLNDGICTNTFDGFSCSCPAGFVGAQCEQLQSCGFADPCSNQGYCSSAGKCVCPKGWRGSRCEIDVNECETNPCENFGTCINRRGSHLCVCLDGFEGERCERNTDYCVGNQCAPGSTCVDGAGSYTCQCPEGKGGRYCNETLACRPDTCINGYCLEAKCICDSGWTGDKCDEDIDECVHSPCADGATCVNRKSSFECICPEGRRGHLCESATCSSDRECLNGGRCSKAEGECKCAAGFAGANCERAYRDPCINATCTENKVCVPKESTMLGFSCECPRGFGGRLCTIPTNCSNQDKTDSYSCSLSGCSRLAGNGICDQQCNHFACGFDGGDCSAGVVPFSRCPDASYCARRYKDGQCDQRCNNEPCLFDGFDCAGSVPEIRKNGTMTDLTLIILVKPETFVRKVDEFLSALAGRLRTTVSIKKTQGEMEVFEWDSQIQQGARVHFGSRTDARVEYYTRARRATEEIGDLRGILVVIQIDLAECSRECFSNATSVALFLGAAEAKENLDREMPIHNALVVTHANRPEETKSNSLAIVAAVLIIALVVVGVVVTGLKRRHVIEAPEWIPPSKEAARESSSNYYSSNLLGMNGYQGFQAFGEPSAKMQAPVFKCRPAPIALPASTPLELAASGEERITPEMRQFTGIIGRYERTPLHWLALNAVKSSADVESDCLMLISWGMELNKQDEDGNTALHYACKNARISMVRRLLEAGADPSIDNEQDMTPLHVAAMHFDDQCMELLIAHKFYKDTTKFDLVDVKDRTALMLYAAESCNSIRGAELLVKAGADVNYSGDKKRSHSYQGRTALHHAAEYNKDNRKMIEFLVAKNANKDAQDNQEATPLWLAVNSDNFNAVDELLKAGASLDFADQKERTPESLAFDRGYAKISERLRVARLRCPLIFSSFPVRSTPIQPPRIIKKPVVKKFKSPTPSSDDTTPSPAGLKASTSSGPSFLDSPHSDRPNSSSEIGGSPVYTPAYTQQPMQPIHPMQQQQPQQHHQMQSAAMRPSPPYDTQDPNGFYASMPLPPLSLNQNHAYDNYYPAHSGYNSDYNPPACPYQNQQ